MRLGREVEVDNGVGNLIADLIGMPLRYGLAGKKIVSARHRLVPIFASFGGNVA
jgi:hypothetical protein